jgi:hypothetical protein
VIWGKAAIEHLDNLDTAIADDESSRRLVA